MSTLQVTTITTVNNTTPLILQTGNTGGGQIVLNSANSDVQFVGNVRIASGFTGDGSGLTIPAANVANAAFGVANTALQNTSGVSFNGNFYVSNGNLGVGTTSPSQKLHVLNTSGDAVSLTTGGTGYAGYSVVNGNGRSGLTGGLRMLSYSGGTAEITNGSNAPLNFGTNNTERMRIDANGNVGIGTTAPSSLLHINSTASIVRPIVTATTGFVDWQVASTGGNLYLGIDNSAGGVSGTAYGRHIFSDGAYPIDLFTNSINRMRITSDGRVGIGTTSPTYPLVVSKNGYQGLEVSVDGTADAPVLISYNRANGAYSRVTVAAANIYFLTGTASVSERMVIGSTGVQSIQFAPTQVASADANTLDDYEEGTFTPALQGGTTAGTFTYAVRNAAYTKIGRVVNCHIHVNFSSATGAAGSLLLTGLPFTSDNYEWTTGNMGYTAGSGTLPNQVMNPQNTPNLLFWNNGAQTQWNTATSADMYMFISYRST